MNLIKKTRMSLLVFVMSHLAFTVSAQDWRKIVPLGSTCEDVKTILKVNDCKAPDSFYKFPDMTVYVLVSDGRDKWKVRKGTITRLDVSLTNLSPLKGFLKDFDIKIEDFEVFLDGDLLDSKIYTNDKKGISFVVRTWDTDDDGKEEEYVSGVTLSPPNCKNK